MSESPALMVAILVLALVALGVVAVKMPKIRGLILKIAGGVAAALAAVVALFLFQKERSRAKDVSASTKEVKSGREDAKEDVAKTEAEIEQEVAVEEELHEEAADEQESLKTRKRERLKA